LPSSKELADVAFHSSKLLRDADGAEWLFKNHKVVPVEGGFALISEGALIESSGSHSTSGRLDVFYFGDRDEGIYVKERFPEAIRIGSWGAIGEWATSDKFTPNPVIYASGGFTGQGVTEGCTSLTELTAEGPRTVALIPDYYGGTSVDGEEFQTEGKISKILKGEGFDVVYAGTDSGRLHYKWNGVKFTTDDKAVLSHCGFE
ncbi:MAG: hypothetical protein ACR2FJ_02115, partial [Qipengyuania sp.]